MRSGRKSDLLQCLELHSLCDPLAMEDISPDPFDDIMSNADEADIMAVPQDNSEDIFNKLEHVCCIKSAELKEELM